MTRAGRNKQQQQQGQLYADSQPWTNFTRGIASAATYGQYSYCLRVLMRFMHVQAPDDLLAYTDEELENSLMDFVADQKKRGVGASLIRVRLSAIKKF